MIGKVKCRVPHGHTAFHFSIVVDIALVKFVHVGENLLEAGIFDVLRGVTVEDMDLNPEQVQRLKDEFGVYIVKSGRMCVASLNKDNVKYTAEAIKEVL